MDIEGFEAENTTEETHSLDGRLLFELTSFEYAALNPKKEEELAGDIKLLSDKAYHGSSMGHSFKGADSPLLMESIYYNLPVAVIGTRPFTFTDSHDFWKRAGDAWEHFRDNLTPDSPISIGRAVRHINDEFLVYPDFKREAAIRFAYSHMYPDAVMEFQSYEEADDHRRKYDDGRPVSIVFSELLERAPGPTAFQAIEDGYFLSLDLFEIRNGVSVNVSKSHPNKATKQIHYDWKQILDSTLERASIIRVKADPDKIERRRREITNTARGSATILNEMLEYIKANGKFKGLFIVDLEPRTGQYHDTGIDFNVVYQMAKHLEWIFQDAQGRHKPVGPKIVR